MTSSQDTTVISKHGEVRVIRRGYADSRYGQLHYRIATPAETPRCPPLLCLHQTPQSGWEWEPIMPALAHMRVVVAPDTPGYGASDAPPAPARIEDFAEIFMAFLDSLQAGQQVDTSVVDIIGYHTGAITTTEIARRWPGRVRRVVLIGLAVYDTSTRQAKLDALHTFPTPLVNDLSHVTQFWDIMSPMVDRRTSPAWRHRFLAEALATGLKLPWGFEAVYRYDFAAAIAEVLQPALILNLGDDLAAVTAANAHRYANGRMISLPSASHGIMTLEPERMAGIIENFLVA